MVSEVPGLPKLGLYAPCCRYHSWQVHGNHDTFDLGVILESILALLPAPATLLVAAKGGRHVKAIVSVDPESPPQGWPS